MIALRRIVYIMNRFLFGRRGLDLSGRMLHGPHPWPLGRVTLVLALGELLPAFLMSAVYVSPAVDISMATLLIVQPAAVLVVIWLANPYRDRAPENILPADLDWRSLLKYAVSWGIGLRLISAVVVLIQAAAGMWHDVTNNPLLLADQRLSAWEMTLIVFTSVLLVPVAEELFYRGIMYRSLGQHFSLAGAAVISTGVWTLLHGSLALFPAIFVLGICLLLLYESTGTLWAPIAAHVGFNLTSFIFLWLMPGAF